MKAQIVSTQDFCGEHNKDLTKSAVRLSQGGSWKRQRVIVLLPSADTVPAKCALSWWNLSFPPNNGNLKWLCLGMEVGDAYSTAIEQILANSELRDWEYILTLEHDNAPPQEGLLKLLGHMEEHPEFSAISGLYWTKGIEHAVAQIWGDISDTLNFRPQIPRTDGGLQECWGLGMGFCLFRLSMFKDQRLRKPWFVTQTTGGISTQDLYGWNDFRKYGYRCCVATDVKVGHYDLRGDFGGIPDMMY